MNNCFPYCERREVSLSAKERPLKTLNNFFLLLQLEAIARCNLTRQINFNVFPIVLASLTSLFITAVQTKRVVIL